LRLFTEEFLQSLSAVRFTGDVWAVPEGTVVFPSEPIVQVIAPILEAQLAETFVVNQLHLRSVITSPIASPEQQTPSIRYQSALAGRRRAQRT
jgi:nicotinate phosphoribosyltransferase